MNITIVYDNLSEKRGFEPSHGFSCFIEGLEKRILFDTGTKGDILLLNMKKAGIQPRDIDTVFLSHDHHDHTGGLPALCEENREMEVFVPASFPPEFQRKSELKSSRFVWVQLPSDVCMGALSTGELGKEIREQSLLLKKDGEFVLITGCAHPGVLYILKRSKELLSTVPEMVLGGFHLMRHPEAEVRSIARELNAMGVKRVGPCHCTGERAIDVFREEFGEDFLSMGVGARIEVP